MITNHQITDGKDKLKKIHMVISISVPLKAITEKYKIMERKIQVRIEYLDNN